MTTWLHQERLRAVEAVVTASGARHVADLGCGGGDMFLRLARLPGITRLTGLDVSADALERLRARLARLDPPLPEVTLAAGSVLDPLTGLVGPAGLAAVDCALMIEVIEHLDPAQLSRLEGALFARLRPRVAIITTPNAEFNPLLGVPAHRMRHPGHRFEWDRARFRAWGRRVAAGAGYGLRFDDIGGRHPELGGASQMAVFEDLSNPAGAVVTG